MEGERERERERDREDRKEVPTSNIGSLPPSFLLPLPALSRVSRDERAGRLGSCEWIIINRYFRQSRPFILRHATPIIYRRSGRWREEERSKSEGREREREEGSAGSAEMGGGDDAPRDEGRWARGRWGGGRKRRIEIAGTPSSAFTLPSSPLLSPAPPPVLGCTSPDCTWCTCAHGMCVCACVHGWYTDTHVSVSSWRSIAGQGGVLTRGLRKSSPAAARSGLEISSEI